MGNVPPTIDSGISIPGPLLMLGKLWNLWQVQPCWRTYATVNGFGCLWSCLIFYTCFLLAFENVNSQLPIPITMPAATCCHISLP